MAPHTAAPGATRVFHGFSAYGDNDSNDCNGHGTHVAGTIGGVTYGVAKNTTLVAGTRPPQPRTVCLSSILTARTQQCGSSAATPRAACLT